MLRILLSGVFLISFLLWGHPADASNHQTTATTKVSIKKSGTGKERRNIVIYRNKAGNDKACIEPYPFTNAQVNSSGGGRLDVLGKANLSISAGSARAFTQKEQAELLKTAFFQLCNDRANDNMNEPVYRIATERLMLAVSIFILKDLFGGIEDDSVTLELSKELIAILKEEYVTPLDTTQYCVHDLERYSEGAVIFSPDGAQSFRCERDNNGRFSFQPE